VAQITDTKFVGDNALNGADLRLNNDQSLRARNQANSADLNLLKLDTSNRVRLGDSTTLPIVIGSQISSDPTGVTAGLYYNTTSNDLKYYNGTAWFAKAKDDLSNLASTTAANQDILMTGTKSVRVANDVAFKGRNQFNSADIGLIRAGTSGQVLIGNASANVFIDGANFAANAHNTYNCGSAVFYWANGYFITANVGGGTIGLQTTPAGNAGVSALGGSTTGADVGLFTQNNANNDSVSTRFVDINTGNKTHASSTGNTGDINLRVGVVSGTGTRGRIVCSARTIRIPTQSSAPTATEAGEMYYDTTTNKSYTWDGSTWQAHW
jgi:hypothetical protein